MSAIPVQHHIQCTNLALLQIQLNVVSDLDQLGGSHQSLLPPVLRMFDGDVSDHRYALSQ